MGMEDVAQKCLYHFAQRQIFSLYAGADSETWQKSLPISHFHLVFDLSTNGVSIPTTR